MVGDRDHLRLVFDHQHGIALVAQLDEQLVHPRDVVRVQPDRRLVEDIGDIGQRRPQVPDHLDPLSLSPTQRPGRTRKAQVPQPDLGERVEQMLQVCDQRCGRRFVQVAHPAGEIGDLHRAGVRDVDAPDQRRPGAGGQSRPVAFGAGLERHGALDERAHVRLHRLGVLRQHRLADLGDQAFVGQIDALDLNLGGLLVQQVVQFAFTVVAKGFVGVEEARPDEDAAIPAIHRITGHLERTLAQRLRVVVELRVVDVLDLPGAFTAWAHAADQGVGLLHRQLFPRALGDLDRPGTADGRNVERESLR